MRSLLRLSLPLLGLFLILFSTGCGDDTGTGGVTLPPVLRLNSGAELVSGDQDLELTATSFLVNIAATTGDADLNNLRIEENGLLIPAARLNFRTGQTAQNPLNLTLLDPGGFTYEIEIFGNPGTVGVATYTFTVTDGNNLSATERVDINFIQTGPVVQLVAGDGLVVGDATVNTFGGVFEVRVQSTATADDLASITVLENGEVLDDSRVSINGGNVDSMNPLVFAGGEERQGTYRFRISPEGTSNDSRVYTFRATDVNGVTGETSVTITFDTPPGTPLIFNMSGAFFNAVGSGLGGFDLDTGMAVGRTSDQSELRDQGIDTRVATGTGENWRRQIGEVNGSTLVMANLSVLGDGVGYDDVTLAEEIQQAFEAGTPVAGADNFPDAGSAASGDIGGNGENVTMPLNGPDANNPGEILAVRKGDRYYLVRIDAVNQVANSNNDNYQVSVKY